MDATSLLREDHLKVLQMLDTLEHQPTARTGAGHAELSQRKRMVTELIIAESRHEAAEQQYFWPAVRKWVPGGERLAEHAVEQEQSAKQVLHKLDKAEAQDPEFEQLLSTFIAEGREHIHYEEDEVWPKLRRAVDSERLESLGRQLARAKEIGPTRPHPNTPPNPTALRAAGPAVAAMDKMRDAVTGRGEER